MDPGRALHCFLAVHAGFVCPFAGVYENPVYGSVTQKRAFDRGTYLLVPSTFSPTAARFTIKVFSTSPVTLSRR